MPCLITLFALATPRAFLLFLWLFTSFLTRVYGAAIWIVLGFIFAPITTIAYALAINYNGEVSGWYAGLIILSVLMDLGIIGSGSRARR